MSVARNTIENIRDAARDDYGALDGWCHRNALFLAEKLYDKGVSPYLVWGYSTAENTSFKTMDEVEKSGFTHFWVEAMVGNKKRVIDLYSIDTMTYGEIIFDVERPRDYDIPANDPAYVPYYNGLCESELLNITDYTTLKQNEKVVETI